MKKTTIAFYIVYILLGIMVYASLPVWLKDVPIATAFLVFIMTYGSIGIWFLTTMDFFKKWRKK